MKILIPHEKKKNITHLTPQKVRVLTTLVLKQQYDKRQQKYNKLQYSKYSRWRVPHQKENI